ncbi:MAG: inorganic triphosphatase, partial [Alphaproteobacteria bacterium]|nr:inorganic triphosphatase [Alphaproteobacteria bacterium]
MNREIEIKLRLPQRALSRVAGCGVIASSAQGEPKGRRLVSVYWDTPELALAGRDTVLRVRRVGRRLVQTIKRGEDVALGPHARNEWEARLKEPRPAREAITEAEGLAALDGIDFTRLAPVFETQIHRRTWIIEHDGGKAELALDSGRIVAGDKSEKLAEIEIELIDGPPATVIEIAKRLAAELPLAIESRDKAARGYALLKGLAPPPVRAATVALDPGMSAREALILLARGSFGQVRRNEAAARAGIDIEGVHQMRVGLRRFRALLGVFRKQLAAEPLAALAEELRWLQGNLGPAREWDVFIDETITPLIEKRPQEMGLRALRDAAEKARQAAYHKL